MIRLVAAELHRLRSRRLTWIAAVMLVLALGGLQLVTYQAVRPTTASERSQAAADYEQAKQDYDQNRGQERAGELECVQQGGTEEQCSSEPQPEWYSAREPVPFGEIAPFLVTTAFFFAAFALALVAASSIGAEFATGALANWLTFVPDRNRVLLAKLLALVLACTVAAAVALAATVGLAVAISQLTGAPTTGVDRLWGQATRGTVLVVALAVLAFAVALLTRHTVGAVGALVGLFLVSSVLTFLVEVISGLGWLKPLLPQNQISAFLNDGYSYPKAGSMLEETNVEPPMLTITFAESGLYWLVVLTAVLALCFGVFRRRDVN